MRNIIGALALLMSGCMAAPLSLIAAKPLIAEREWVPRMREMRAECEQRRDFDSCVDYRVGVRQCRQAMGMWATDAMRAECEG